MRNHIAGTAAVVVRDLGGNPLRTYIRYASGSWAWNSDDVNVGRLRVASVYPSGVQYVHSDHLGSPKKITNASGSVVSYSDFYPFGLPAATNGIQGRWFAGYELEHQNTGTTYTDDLYFLHARWYFPSVSRFLAPDPVRGNPAAPQSFSLYAYVQGNPIRGVDPGGLTAVFDTTSRRQAMARVAEELRLFESLAMWQALLESGPFAVVTVYASGAVKFTAKVDPREVEAARQSILGFLGAPGVMESIRHAFTPYVELNAKTANMGMEASGYIIRVRKTGEIVFRFGGVTKGPEKGRVTFSVPVVAEWDYLALAHTHPPYPYSNPWPSQRDIDALERFGKARFMLVFSEEGIYAYDRDAQITMDVAHGKWW